MNDCNEPLSAPIIRPADLRDAEAIRQINLRAFGYDGGPDETAARLAEILKKSNVRIFAAELEGRVIGYIHGSDYDCTYMPPLKNILALGVLEEYRGSGVGRSLVDAFERWAKEDGCAGVRLVSGFDRAGAHRFYLRCGYSDRKDQKNFIKWF
jgi:predicted N-acetyltransferase YhbS